MKGTDMETKTIHLALSPRVAALVAYAVDCFSDELLAENQPAPREEARSRIGAALDAVRAEILSQGVADPTADDLLVFFETGGVVSAHSETHVETPAPDVSTPDAKAIADKMAKAGREAAEGETEDTGDGR